MSIIQQLKDIENNIYTIPYDDLNDYLKGIRDMVNLLNGNENLNLSEYIRAEINKHKGE